MKTKRIKLRGWVLVVLKTILIIDMFICCCNIDSSNITVLIYGTLILIPITYLLIRYGDI